MPNIPGRKSYQGPLILIKNGEGRGYQLARHYGNDGDARVNVAKCVQHYHPSPRTTQQPGVNIELETREQTILSYQLSPQTRAIINSQESLPAESRKEGMPAVKILNDD